MSQTSTFPGSEFQLHPRLVNAGEEVTITLRGCEPGDHLDIFPHYLERCDPERLRQSPQPLGWLDEMAHESLPAAEVNHYIPIAPGNYLARYTSSKYGVEYRYFAAIDETSVIYRPAIWSCWSYPALWPVDGGPEIHNGGLPFDWCLTTFKQGEAQVSRLVDEQQRFGGGMVLGSADIRAMTLEEAVTVVQEAVAELRRSGLDVGRVGNFWTGAGMTQHAARVAKAAGFEVIDGYVPRGDKFGMGAPYYPFYISPTDYRFPSQTGPSDTIACIFDFVGSWHFHGPVGFHRPSARGSWERARYYIDLAAQEAVLTARNSGVNNFITTLVNYESPQDWESRESGPAYRLVWDAERGREFLANYLHLLAFEQTRRWPIVFARAADYADYMRAHYCEMPRRIISSITHDIDYDRYWTDESHERGVLPRGYVPFDQNLQAFKDARVMPQYNMAMSYEFINYNDNQRTCRFEYACPKPLHYYDLTGSEAWPEKPVESKLPDPAITMSTRTSDQSFEVTYEIKGDASFTDYMLAIWDIPREFKGYRVETNAKEFCWIENTDGNCRGLVRFDLIPQCRVMVSMHRREGKISPPRPQEFKRKCMMPLFSSL
ncbi:MAG: hypothetical protein ACYCZF_06310 [Anaerolineae bacterium]